MHFSSLLISSFLLAPAVLAERPREFRRSLLDLVEKRNNVEVNTIYAGATLTLEQDDKSFYSVSGTFTVPNLSGQDGTINSAFVGIYSDGCTPYFRSGITFQLLPKGAFMYNAWYELYLSDPQPLPDITMSPGDVLEIEVTVSELNMLGHVDFKNQSKNQTSSQTILSQHAFCSKSVGWFVQAYPNTQLANFGTIAFKDAVATRNDGVTYRPLGATIYDIEQNGQNVTSVSVDENSVTIKYTGT
ncbi:peptidase G1 [Boletus edulis]|nr:peptidase G1 [Boletus edulis]